MSLFLLTAKDGWMMLGALGGLGALVGLGEILRARGVAARTTRRLVHTSVSLFVAATPLLFTRPLPVYGLAALFALLNAGARYGGRWPSLHEVRPDSWGTVALPLSVLPALAATWSVGPDRILAFQTAYLVLAVADPAASWVGRWKNADSWVQGSTIPGSLTFGGITLVLTASMLAGIAGGNGGRILGVALGTAVVATVAEAISHRGWDNFFVVAAVILTLVPIQEQVLGLGHLGVALVVGGGFGGLAYCANALDRCGAVTGGLFAASLVGLGGWPWIVPGIVFFGLSSALTGMKGAESLLSGEAPRRTQAQVLANGGVAWGALAVGTVVPGAWVWSYVSFVGALAAAAADTWATELGAWSSSRPWSLRSGHRVPAGTSGAISMMGTGAAALGALSVVGTALLVDGPLGGPIRRNAALLVAAGMFGMGADSVAGAFLQAHYRSASTGQLVERPLSDGETPVQGWIGVGNNAVNLIGTSVGAIVAVAGFMVLG